MEETRSPEEVNQLIKMMDFYILRPTKENFRRIEENLDKIEAAAIEAKFYLLNLDPWGSKRELKPYAKRFLRSFDNLSRYLVNRRKMRTLQEMDSCKTPYTVADRLKRVS